MKLIKQAESQYLTQYLFQHPPTTRTILVNNGFEHHQQITLKETCFLIRVQKYESTEYISNLFHGTLSNNVLHPLSIHGNRLDVCGLYGRVFNINKIDDFLNAFWNSTFPYYNRLMPGHNKISIIEYFGQN